MSGLWLWAAVALPPTLAVVALTDRRGRWSPLLVAVAAVPGLVAGLGGEVTASAHWLLLETVLRTDGLAQTFLVAAALLWLSAGLVAHGTLEDRRRRFAALSLLALGGNATLVLAADVVTFYTGFALMTFAAYGLVVHDGTTVARRAGRIYVLMAVLGEVVLLAGLLLAVHAAGTLQVAAVPGAVAAAEYRALTVGLLLGGLGVKVGLVGLHMWLPLAHPAAPVAASAVLSGAMIKAGLLGWLRVLPLGEAAMPGWGATMLVLGLLGAFGAVVVGLTQHQAKVNLAYSSVSQMGTAVALVGVALANPAVASAALAAAAVFALHHGLAKGALFLGAGAVHGPLALVGSGLAAAALAGAPLTSGIASKYLIKDVAGDAGSTGAALLTSLPLTSVATALLLARLLWLQSKNTKASATRWAWAGWAIAVTGTLLATWTVPAARAAGVDTVAPLAASIDWDAIWPLLVAIILIALVVRRPVHVRELPPGDLINPLEALGRHLAHQQTPTTTARMAAAIRSAPAAVATGSLRLLDVAEAALERGRRGVSTATRARLARTSASSLRLLTTTEMAFTRWRGATSLLVVILVALLWGVAR